jgi:hypothetical protein
MGRRVSFPNSVPWSSSPRDRAIRKRTEKACGGFDWTPGIALALLGAVAYINVEKEVERREKEHREEEEREKQREERRGRDLPRRKDELKDRQDRRDRRDRQDHGDRKIVDSNRDHVYDRDHSYDRTRRGSGNSHSRSSHSIRGYSRSKKSSTW